VTQTITSDLLRPTAARPNLATGPYTADPYTYQRRKTRVVMVGNVAVGGDNPLRIQSMTTTLTKEVDATYAQTLRLVAAGCEIVRITTPTSADARALGEVKARLLAQGLDVPLVADIHFSPAAAMEAALWADKVRINPGNFADAKLFKIIEYTDEVYQSEVDRLEEKLAPVIARCKERGISMRIGTNHGSLSDRIMNRYGDTPLGMVESALELVRICEKYDYRNLILSMKASNPKVMIQAYRLLAGRMAALGMDYPFHLGVTEAGNGEDGRIKSAIGIGSLLEDGIGDTIRVSLTEDPEFEIPVAYLLAERYTPRGFTAAAWTRSANGPWPEMTDRARHLIHGPIRPLFPAVKPDADTGHPPSATRNPQLPDGRDPFTYDPRWTHTVAFGKAKLGGTLPAAVLVSLARRLPALPQGTLDVLALARRAGPQGVRADVLSVGLTGPDDLATLRAIVAEMQAMNTPFPVVAITHRPELIAPAMEFAAGVKLPLVYGDDPTRLLDAALAVPAEERTPLWVDLIDSAGPRELRARQQAVEYPIVDAMMEIATRLHEAGVADAVLSLTLDEPSYRLRAYRLLDARLRAAHLQYPLHLIATEVDPDDDTSLLETAVSLGALFTDGIGSSAQLYGPGDPARRVEFVYNLLQGAGARLTKTEFIACPSCGRTLFDLQSTTERIKARTGHLVGVKIAVMGCIVNGLGELADADFGYMGGAPGKVNLFVGKECIEKNVPTAIAVDKLIDLIKAHGRWTEPGETGDAA
jgi:(E)-4-hydroxy-3-methylbut-2-enyl-diphosphate synthase